MSKVKSIAPAKTAKAIEIKTHETLKADQDKNLTTLDLMKAVLNHKPADGFSVDEMRRRFSILDKIDSIDPKETALELNDGEYGTLVQLIKPYKWGVMDKFIVDFVDSVI